MRCAFDRVESELHEYLFWYPRNVTHFVWLYETSEYLQCNRALADQMEKKYHLYQNASKFNTTVVPVLHVVHIIEKFEKRYWLAGGALLGMATLSISFCDVFILWKGWYRHCGMIPYTHDTDIGLFAEEYDESIRHAFLGNPSIYLWSALGLVRSSSNIR